MSQPVATPTAVEYSAFPAGVESHSQFAKSTPIAATENRQNYISHTSTPSPKKEEQQHANLYLYSAAGTVRSNTNLRHTRREHANGQSAEGWQNHIPHSAENGQPRPTSVRSMDGVGAASQLINHGQFQRAQIPFLVPRCVMCCSEHSNLKHIVFAYSCNVNICLDCLLTPYPTPWTWMAQQQALQQQQQHQQQ